MLEAIKNRWVLLLVLVVFIVAKIPALHYPFYWDESWSYAPAVKLMYLHGPSLMPNAIDLGYSRGHPLLFYASAAAWMKVFGDSHVAQHSFSLFIFSLLLVSVYEVCLKLFSKRMAILSLLLVATQVIFFVQSTLLLPEIMVGWLCLLTLYFYSTHKYLFTFLSCTALMLTKESGFTLGLVLGLHATWYLCKKGISTKERLLNILPLIGAALITGLFFIVQKKLNGWYLFPEHTGLIDPSWQMFRGKLRYCLEIIFTHQYRYFLFLLLITLSIATAINKRNIRYAYPALLAVILYILAGNEYGYLTRRVLYPVGFMVLLFTFHTLLNLNRNDNKSRTFIYLTVFFLGTYLSFTSLNFFTNRYLISSLVAILLLSAYCFDLFLARFKPPLFYALITCLFVVAGFAFRNNCGTGDVDLGIYNAMQVQEDVVTYLEQQQLYDSPVAASSSLQREHLTKPFTGFLHSNRIFTNVTYEIQPHTEYVVTDNIEPDTTMDKAKLAVGYKEVYRIRKGQAQAEVYKKK